MKTICNLDDSIWAEISKQPKLSDADCKIALDSAKANCNDITLINQPNKPMMVKIGDKYFSYHFFVRYASFKK